MLALITILRPLNLLQATLAVVLTTAFLSELDQQNTLFLLIISVVCINGAGNIINDIYDIEIDRINRPHRPLPAGKMKISTARFYMFFLFSWGIFCSWLISFETFAIAGLLATPILIAYSAWFKRLPLLGNLTVSFMLGLAFIYVGSAFGKIETTFVMALLAFGFTLIRELIKDLEDMDGDGEAGARTLPLIWGEQATIRFTILLMLVFTMLDLLPFVMGVYGNTYLWLVLFGINIPLLICVYNLWGKRTDNTYSRIQLFLKLDIFVGLAAIYFGHPT